MHRIASHRIASQHSTAQQTGPLPIKLFFMLFGLMLMPKPTLPNWEPIEISQLAPDVSLFGMGNADFCRNEYWLRYEPFRSWNPMTCRQPVTGDADGDGLWDMAEAELLWAFLPYLVFDNHEAHLRKMVLVYQATPYSPSESRMPSVPMGEVAYIRIKLVFLFAADTSSCSYMNAEHGGDSESITLHLEGRRDPQTGEMRLWHLSGVTGYRNGSLENLESKYAAHCNALVYPGPYSQQVLDDTYVSFSFNPMLNPSQNAARMDSGLLHPKVFVSKNKHGLYPSHNRCVHSNHGGCDEQCSGGEEFLLPPGFQLLNGIDPVQNAFLSGVQALQNGTEPAGFLLRGNLGEKSRLLIDDLGENGTGWFQREKVSRYCFCGGKRAMDMTDNCGDHCSCDDQWDVECAAGVKSKMMDMSNWVSPCIPDADQDGVPTAWDGDDTNPFLVLDADRDGVPDISSPNEDACRESCQAASDESARAQCLVRCGMLDNCVMAGSICSRYLMQPTDPLTPTSVYYYDCVTIFKNPWLYMPLPRSDDACAPQSAGTYIQPPGSCAPEAWSVTYADVREKQVLTLKNTENEHGLYKCTVPVLEAELALRGGGYRHVIPGTPSRGIEMFDTRGISVMTPEMRPLSWMVCGCKEGDAECEDRFCDPEKDNFIQNSAGWVPLQLSHSDPLVEQSFGQIPNQGLNFRHKPMDIAPQPARKAIENRLAKYPQLKGKKVRARVSYPAVSSSFSGRSDFRLGKNEYSISNALDPVKTSMPERCRKTLKSDFFFDLGDESEADADFIGSMRIQHVIPGHPLGNTKAWVVHAVPEGTAAKAALSEITGPSFTPEFPRGLFVTASQVTTSSLKSARGIGLNKACCTQKSLVLQQPSLVLVSDDWPEPLLIFSTAQGYRGTFWSSWANTEEPLPVLSRPFLFEVGGNPQVAGLSDGQWRILQLNLEQRTASVRRLFEASPTATPHIDSITGQVSFWEGEMQQVALTDAEGGVVTVTLETPVQAGSHPRVLEGAEAGQVIVINPDEGLAYQVDLASGHVHALSLPNGVFTLDAQFGFDVRGGQLWAVVPNEDGTHWTWNFFEPAIDGPWRQRMQHYELAMTKDNPLYPADGLNPPDAPSDSDRQDGCGCAAGAHRASSGFPGFFLIVLAALAWIRRNRYLQRTALLVLVSFALAACDDSHKKIPQDAGPDSDGMDVDADGESVDCSGRQTCVPWVPAQVIPDNQLVPLEDSVCTKLAKYVDGSQVGADHLYPVNCVEVVNGHYYYEVYLVNIDTLDATPIADLQTAMATGVNYLSPYLNNTSTTLSAGACISGNCGVAVYRFPTQTWEMVSPEAGNNITGDGYVLFQHNPDEGALPELMLYDLTTRRTERLVEGPGRPYVYFGDEDLIVWAQIVDNYTRTLMKVLDRDTNLVTVYPEVTEQRMGFPAILEVQKHQIFANLLSAPCADFSVYTEWNLDMWRLDFDTQEWTPIAAEPVWQQVLFSSQWPLVVYLDYGVACTGNYVDEYDYSRMRAYMVIHNLETDVRRPIPLPFDFYRPVALSNNWKLIFRKYDPVRDLEPAYILDLVAAGLVDETGNVIPDPTFPPPPAR